MDFDHDVVFTWNGTTSGVRVPDASWIRGQARGSSHLRRHLGGLRDGSADDKLDVLAYSWQKVLGGEAQHGIVILSPRAVERLESYAPPWPMPKIFRLTKGGKLAESIFEADTINTPSMLCVEDALDGLRWAEEIGGLPELVRRSEANLAAVARWVQQTPWVEFLAADPDIRSSASIYLKMVDPWFTALATEEQASVPKKIVSLLDAEGAAYDVGSYRDAPAGLRLWGGATVSEHDLEALFPWLDWAYAQIKQV